MAVIVKYVVERNGEEKMTFTSKKEADNYDKMLDIADQLNLMLKHAEPELQDAVAENLSLFLASHQKSLQLLLKGKAFDEIQLEENAE
ncbi:MULTISPECIES: YebG family protein [Aliagarivorans]|uniref:YebG family protein n=1 Tax=Aliagarivorans TaxID=882379 RepID=UPI000410C0E7|nr:MULTISPECIES: YebG family protein [Aliagarivorans]